MSLTLPPVGPTFLQDRSPAADRLREVAKDLEATFLSEMLKSTGFGEARSSFGGGIGEEQFASFLRDNYAKSMVETGGIGLAEQLFQSLQRQSGNG